MKKEGLIKNFKEIKENEFKSPIMPPNDNKARSLHIINMEPTKEVLAIKRS